MGFVKVSVELTYAQAATIKRLVDADIESNEHSVTYYTKTMQDKIVSGEDVPDYYQEYVDSANAKLENLNSLKELFN